MIRLMRLNGEELTVNAYQVETVERGADTCVSLMNGKRLFVQETVEDVEALMMDWFRKIHGVAPADVCEDSHAVQDQGVQDQAVRDQSAQDDQAAMVDEESL